MCLIYVFQGLLSVEDILRLSRYLTRDKMLLLQEKFQERCRESDEVSFEVRFWRRANYVFILTYLAREIG